MRRLTDKQRAVVRILDDKWRTLDEIVQRQGRGGLSRGRTENFLLDQAAGFVDYRLMEHEVAGPMAGRHTVREAHYRLTEAGEYLHDALTRRR